MAEIASSFWFNVLAVAMFYAFQAKLCRDAWRNNPQRSRASKVTFAAIAVGLVCVPFTLLAVMRVETFR